MMVQYGQKKSPQDEGTFGSIVIVKNRWEPVEA